MLAALGLAGCGSQTAEQVQQEHRDEALAAEHELQAALDPLDETGVLLGEAVRDSCVTGQHNWKIDDPYDVRCTVEVYRAYHVTGEDFRAAADGVTDAFPECTEGFSDAEETLRDYWDTLQGKQTRHFEKPYRPDYLPSYRLDCAGSEGGTGRGTTGSAPGRPGAEAMQVHVSGWATLPADTETRRLSEDGMGRACVVSSEAQPCEWRGTSAQGVLEQETTQRGWVVFVSGTAEYARTG